MNVPDQMPPEEQWRFVEPVLRWHGWGSPIGFGIGIVCIGACALLIRLALFGF